MFRSVSNMVIAPARTGRDNKSRIAVNKTDHTNKGIASIVTPLVRMFSTVEIKFTAPRIEDTPAKWREKIPRSTEAPE